MSVLRRGQAQRIGLQRGSTVGSSNSLGSQFSRIFIGAYMQMAHNLRALQPCLILGVKCCVNILEEDVVEILITGICYPCPPLPVSTRILPGSTSIHPSLSPTLSNKKTDSPLEGVLRRRSGSLDDVVEEKSTLRVSSGSRAYRATSRSNPRPQSKAIEIGLVPFP